MAKKKKLLKSDQVYHLRTGLTDNYDKCIELGDSPSVKLRCLAFSSFWGGVNSKFFVYVYYPTCSDGIQNFKNRFSFVSYLLTTGSLRKV